MLYLSPYVINDYFLREVLSRPWPSYNLTVCAISLSDLSSIRDRGVYVIFLIAFIKNYSFYRYLNFNLVVY